MSIAIRLSRAFEVSLQRPCWGRHGPDAQPNRNCCGVSQPRPQSQASLIVTKQGDCWGFCFGGHPRWFFGAASAVEASKGAGDGLQSVWSFYGLCVCCCQLSWFQVRCYGEVHGARIARSERKTLETKGNGGPWRDCWPSLLRSGRLFAASWRTKPRDACAARLGFLRPA